MTNDNQVNTKEEEKARIRKRLQSFKVGNPDTIPESIITQMSDDNDDTRILEMLQSTAVLESQMKSQFLHGHPLHYYGNHRKYLYTRKEKSQ
jgi:hypothetical protein